MYGFFLNTLDPTVIDPSIENRLSFATSTLVRGMLTVFAVLAIIWLFVVLLRVFIHDLPKKRATKGKSAPAAVQQAAPVPPAPAPAAMTDAELLAVITAAVAAYQADEGNLPFRVVSFRRVNQ